MARNLPIIWFVVSCMFLAFVLGFAVNEFKIPPYRSIANAAKTIVVGYRDYTAPPYFGQFLREPTDIPLEGLADRRLSVTAEGRAIPGRYLVTGGLNEYREHCPDFGCVALEIDKSGNVVHAYPYRPHEIFAADITGGSFYREAVPSDPLDIMRPLGVEQYDDGDLLITFQSVGSMFPFGAGVARVDRDGNPRWFRFDYSHHWTTLLPDGTVPVPSLRIGEGDWSIPIGPYSARETLPCETQRPQIDDVQFLDGEGQVLRTIDISASLLASNWSAVLAETSNACDPLHLNYIDIIGEDAGPGLTPGDLVLSLRDVSAFAIADRETGEIKRVVRGSFVQQHAVHHLEGSRFILFDNWGGDESGPPSRVLEIDIETGEERRVFPMLQGENAMEPLFSNRGSHIDISPDRQRILVSFSGEGRGFEVDIETGRVLASYDSLHDLSDVSDVPEALRGNAVRALLYGMSYIAP